MSDLFGGTPHWTDSPGDYALKSEAAASHIGSLFLGGLQLAAQREQRNQEMALRLKEFAATEETRKLHNQTLSARLSDDAFDTKTLGEFIPKLNSARTPEDLAALEIPEMRDPQRMHQLTTAISSKAQRLAGTTAWKALADAQADIAKLDGHAIAEINELGGLPQTPDDLTPELYRIIGSHQDRISRTKTEEAMAIRSAAAQVRSNTTDNIDFDTAGFAHAVGVDKRDPLDALEEFPLARTGIVTSTLRGNRDFGAVTGTAKLNYYGREIKQLESSLKDLRENRESDFKTKKGEWREGGEESWKKLQSEISDKEKRLNDFRAKASALSEGTAPVAPASAPTAPAETERVSVIKDGVKGTVPKSQLEQALKEGYSIVK